MEQIFVHTEEQRRILETVRRFVEEEVAPRAAELETLDLVARGEVWPMVTDIRPMAEAEALHERIEQGAVTGRAALLIGSTQ